jgi:hypothetical protein
MNDAATPSPRPGRPSRQQRIERLRLALAREVSREKEEARRRDTRRKIVLGAALLALLQKPDFPPGAKQKMVSLLVPLIGERDRAAVAAFLSELLPSDGCQPSE